MISRLRFLCACLALVVVLLAPAAAEQHSPVLAHRYVLTSELQVFESDLALPAGSAIELVTDAAFIPEPLPGFGAAYGHVRAVVVTGAGQFSLTAEGEADDQVLQHAVAAGEWIGIRNRFRTGLIRPSAPAIAQVSMDASDQPRLLLVAADIAAPLSFVFYAGPVERQALHAIDPQLTGMLFAALWDWLRALCFGMLWLLTNIDSLVGNIGLAIILLSLAVKILMSPLTRIADGLQDSVNRTQALLQPHLDAIKREYKGEEAHKRTLAVYKEHQVHPLYTMKSLAGFLIQIPIFIAAFDMLGENVALDQASFFWIGDLAKPDRWLALPVVLPFFGGHLNLLPILMTGVTVLTSWIQTDPSLTPDLLHRQQMRLFLMAGAFFLLFYTFPAGMVLYWTTNNVLHLIKIKLLPAIGKSNE
jgi:YidC/Oxa1 family membrane protein insertase